MNLKRLQIYSSILLISLLSSCCDLLCERQQHAESLIEKVETFKQETGRLPENEQELKMEAQMHLSFYKKINNEEFEVWYGTGLGASKIYNSKTKTWREEG